MPSIKPFKGIHPSKEYGDRVPISHGIGGDQEKSLAEINANPYSLLHISNPELYLPGGSSLEEGALQEASMEKYREFLDKGILVQDQIDSLYIYRLTQGDHVQTAWLEEPVFPTILKVILSPTSLPERIKLSCR